MKSKNSYSRPTIVIYASEKIQEEQNFNEIVWGIEEEGIPYSVCSCDKRKSEDLSYEASTESAFEVGLGVGEDKIITLHHRKLKKSEPLFSLNLKSESYKIRIMGANAARLVKGIPLKNL